MRVLLFLSSDETANELAAEIAAAATHADAGPAAWRDLRAGQADGAQWLGQAQASHVQLAVLAAAAPETAQPILARTTLAVLVTDLAASAVERARSVSTTLEESGVSFVMLPKAAGWAEEPVAAGSAQETEGEDEEDAADDADSPAATVFALAQFGTVCPIPLRGPVSAQAAELWAYFALRMARLAAQGQERESPRSQVFGRRFPRWSFDAAAVLKWQGRSVDCRVDDVSAGGIGLYAETVPEKATPVVVEVAGFEPMAGTVASVSGPLVGISLDIPLVEQIGFVRRMAAMIATPALAGGAIPRELGARPLRV